MSDTKSEARSDIELANEWVAKPWIKTKINCECTQWADWHKLTQEEKDETETGYEQLAMQAFIAGLSAERTKHERVLQMLEVAKTALHFYANPKTYEAKNVEPIFIPGHPEACAWTQTFDIVEDNDGSRARLALEQIESLK